MHVSFCACEIGKIKEREMGMKKIWNGEWVREKVCVCVCVCVCVRERGMSSDGITSFESDGMIIQREERRK